MKSISCIAVKNKAGVFEFPKSFIRDWENQFKNYSEVRVIVRPDYRKVTSKEHRFYRGPFLDSVMDVFIEAGHPFQKYNDKDRERVHYWLKKNFGPHEEVINDNQPVSMALWTTQQTEKYMEDIRVWMAEIFNAVLPYPNEATPKEG